MTSQSFDLETLEDILPVRWARPEDSAVAPPATPAQNASYAAGENGVPRFPPVGNPRHQVRLNASTHDASGLIRKATPEALANTRRLAQKIEQATERFNRYMYDAGDAATTVIVTYGITSGAARDAVDTLRERGTDVALLVLESLIPVPADVRHILDRHAHIVVAEENQGGLLAEMLFGAWRDARVRQVNGIGVMIRPNAIVSEVERCLTVS